MKFTEILKFYSYIPIFYGLQAILINEKIFQNLSKENQTALINAGKIACACGRWQSVKQHRQGLEFLVKAGIKVNMVRDRQSFVEKIKPVWDKYKETIGGEWFERIVNTQ